MTGKKINFKINPFLKKTEGFCELIVSPSDEHCGREASKRFLWRKTTQNSTGRPWTKPIETYICKEHEQAFRNSLDNLGYFEVEEEPFSLREKVTFS